MQQKLVSMSLAILMLLGMSVPALAEGEPEATPPAITEDVPPAALEAPPATDEAIPAEDEIVEDIPMEDAATEENTVEAENVDDGIMTVSAASASVGGVTVYITGELNAIKDIGYGGPGDKCYHVGENGTYYHDFAGTKYPVDQNAGIPTQITVEPGFELSVSLKPEYEVSVENGILLDGKDASALYFGEDELINYRWCRIKAPKSGTMTIQIALSDDVLPTVVPFTIHNDDTSIIVAGGEWGSSWRNTVTNNNGTRQDVVTTGGEFALDVKNGYAIEVIKGGYVVGTRAPEGSANLPDCTEYVLHVDLDTDEFVISLVKNGEEAQISDTTEPQIEAPPAEDTTAQTGGTFTDVASGVWYADPVEKAYSSGIVKGVTDTTFAPNGTTTRGQTVTMLYRAMGSPGGSNVFSDTTGEVGSAAGWASANGVTNGVSATAFSPNSSITREQLVTMLYRMAGSPPADTSKLASYSDGGSVQSYAQSAVAWAISNGLLTGYGDGTIRPAGVATRAEVCTLIVRYLGAA